MSYTYRPLQLGLSMSEPAVAPRVEKQGVVYTKSWVVDLMLDLAGYTVEADLGALLAIEPAAGDGSFLVPMIERLLASCQHYQRSPRDCTAAILAYELDPRSAEQARMLVTEVLRHHGVEPLLAAELSATWIKTGDYLLEAPKLPPADFVIGNPPYIRLEDMDETTAHLYRSMYKTMVGRADLYVAFFEAALRQLKPQGVCTYVCADRWMLNQYGSELRRLITIGYRAETIIEMHQADAFETTVSAYPAITVLRRAPQGEAVVGRASTGIETAGSVSIRRVLDSVRRLGEAENGLPGLKAACVKTWFRGNQPWPCYSPERLALLQRLEAEFEPLESADTGTKVGIGVATGADDVFVTTDQHLMEPSRLLPLAMAGDTTSGQLAWSGRFLVNPWNDRGLVELSKYPRMKAYFTAHEARLRNRHVGKRNAIGWYRTIDRVDQDLGNRAKLYIADIKDRLNPVLDPGTTYPHHNLYFVSSSAWDEEVLGGLLLSDVAQFFVECYGVRMRGGYLRFQAQYLRRIRVPRPQELSSVQVDALREAFRQRDRDRATEAAFNIYGIEALPPEIF